MTADTQNNSHTSHISQSKTPVGAVGPGTSSAGHAVHTPHDFQAASALMPGPLGRHGLVGMNNVTLSSHMNNDNNHKVVQFSTGGWATQPTQPMGTSVTSHFLTPVGAVGLGKSSSGHDVPPEHYFQANNAPMPGTIGRHGLFPLNNMTLSFRNNTLTMIQEERGAAPFAPAALHSASDKLEKQKSKKKRIFKYFKS